MVCIFHGKNAVCSACSQDFPIFQREAEGEGGKEGRKRGMVGAEGEGDVRGERKRNFPLKQWVSVGGETALISGIY